MWAAVQGLEVVMKLLLARDDVDPDSKNSMGRTPLARTALDEHELWWNCCSQATTLTLHIT